MFFSSFRHMVFLLHEEWMPYKTELPIHKNESIVFYSKIDNGPKEAIVAQYAK